MSICGPGMFPRIIFKTPKLVRIDERIGIEAAHGCIVPTGSDGEDGMCNGGGLSIVM